ncbi:hypothetical protein ACI2KT_35130 [Ensifer adhaerens]|uniref:hypothetical protein n=1 Tax=Ensifer adhaerens TaxID=106592 RepID=UPI00384DF68D
MKRMFFATVGLAAFALVPEGAKAQNATWGCQVLLCAASQSPSWQGVPYCVPPMTKLINAMKKPGFSWPICHEAKAGKPGREQYEDCPAGTSIGYSESGRDGVKRTPNKCVQVVDRCENRSDFHARYGNADANDRANIELRTLFNDRDNLSDNGCKVQITRPRPQRSNPYFFDIPNDKGVKERFWFNLRT